MFSDATIFRFAGVSGLGSTIEEPFIIGAGGRVLLQHSRAGVAGD